MAFNINEQTKELNIVIRVNKRISKNDLISWLKNNCELYSLIVHDKDTDSTGVLVPIHYHIVCRLLKRTRITTSLNNIVSTLKLTNSHGIEIDKVISYVGSLQYLIHKNDIDKFQYNVTDIITNMDINELKTLIDSDIKDNVINFDSVYRLCIQSSTLLDVIRSVGFTKYHIYRNTILDIWKTLKNT